MLIFHQWGNYNYSCDYNVKKLLSIIISVICFCAQYSCEKPVLDNPYGDDIMPDIIIDSDSLDGSTIDSSSIRISWTPNIYAFEFSYYLFPVDTIYSGWNTDTTAHYTFLDEGEYLFFIKSRYQEGEEKESPDSLSFTIDAISGPGLRIYPLFVEVEISAEFTVDIYAEEVNNLTGAEIILTYEPELISLDSTFEGAFLSETQGQSITIKEHDPDVGYLVITLATYDDNAVGLTGSGSLAGLTFKANANMTGSCDIILSEESRIKKEADIDVELSSIVSGLVEVK